MEDIFYIKTLQQASRLPRGQHLELTCMTLDEADERANKFIHLRDSHEEFRALEIKTDGMEILIRNLAGLLIILL